MFRKKTHLTVSDLAKVATCEQQFVFDHRFGQKRSTQWKRAARRGKRAHKNYELKSSLGFGARDERCFIASATFGPQADETNQFRDFRDNVLTKTAAGRLVIAVYYALSPTVARMVSRNRILKRLSKSVLRALLIAAGRGL